MRSGWRLIKATTVSWWNDNALTLGSSLAYYTTFSIAPLLIITIAIAGFVFGKQATTGEIFQSVRSLVGSEGARAIQSMVLSSSRHPGSGILATVLGGITLVLGASGAFQQLQQSLNVIWKVRSRSDRSWWSVIRQRLMSFSMVLVIAFLLLVSLVVSAGLAALGRYMSGILPGGEVFWHVVNSVASLALVTLLFAAIYKILPDVKLSWRDVSMGAFSTALLFTIGKFLIGFYLGRSTVASTYGAAGSLIIVLLWVYYSSAIVFFGAEFTRAYATRDGRAVPPKEGAELYPEQVTGAEPKHEEKERKAA